MKTKNYLSVVLASMTLTTANAQEIEDERFGELPTELIVYKNPNVKGIRLDSIVSIHPVYGKYDSTIVFDYPKDGGEPTSTNDPHNIKPTNYDTEICGVKLHKESSTYYPNPSNKKEIVKREGLGMMDMYYILKEEKFIEDVLVNSERYEYNDKFDIVSHINEKYDENGNIIAGEKEVSTEENGYNIVTNYKYDNTKKDYLASKKTKTKTNSEGWIAEQYIYNADANGIFSDYDYAIVRDKKDEFFDEDVIFDASKEEYVGSVKGTMTVTENGIKKTENIVTEYYINILDTGNNGLSEVINNIERSVTYKADENGKKGDNPFKIEQKIIVFNNSCNGVKKYETVDLLTTNEEQPSFECRTFDKHGFVEQNYNLSLRTYTNYASYKSGYLNIPYYYDCNYRGNKYEYYYNDKGINVGVKSYGTYSSPNWMGYGREYITRDLNYTNVMGTNDICPIIYTILVSDSNPGPGIVSIYYYSSADGTTESKESTAIADITDGSQQTEVIVYDINGKIVKTCGNGKVTLPEAQGIYIINDGNKIFKVRK